MQGVNRNWSDLLPEILHIILQMLSLPDCFKFGAVCKSWRSLFLEKRHISRPPPCLIVTLKFPSLMAKLPFWIFHGGKFQVIHNPRPGILDSEYIVGSSMGWLVLGSARESGLQLLNSFSGERIPLPNIFSGENHMGQIFGYTYFNGLHVILSSPPTSVECVIVATGIRRGRNFLSICKPGGQEWIMTACESLPTGFPVRNVVFYKGELYVLGEQEDILIYEYNSDPRITYKCSISGNGSIKDNQCWVVSGEVLYSIVWNVQGIQEVFKLMAGRDFTWVRVKSLGDQVFVIGNHAAESFNIQGLMGSGFEANCIYYFVNRWQYKQMVKFSVASNSIETIPIRTCFEWLMPQSW